MQTVAHVTLFFASENDVFCKTVSIQPFLESSAFAILHLSMRVDVALEDFFQLATQIFFKVGDLVKLHEDMKSVSWSGAHDIFQLCVIVSVRVNLMTKLSVTSLC